MSLSQENNKNIRNKSVKRKHSELTIEKKLCCIRRLESGEDINSLTTEFNVDRSTIWRWRRKKSSLEDFQKTNNRPRKRIRGPNNPVLDEAVWIWFTHSRLQGIPITGPFVKEKAKQLNIKLQGSKQFVASEGWLNNWKERREIKSFGIAGEKLSADVEGALDFKIKLARILEEEKYGPSQIFNADETGLNFKMLPGKTLAVSQKMISKNGLITLTKKNLRTYPTRKLLIW
nr:PREDICTED: jerky protein homolog-like [Fopius arisanus]